MKEEYFKLKFLLKNSRILPQSEGKAESPYLKEGRELMKKKGWTAKQFCRLWLLDHAQGFWGAIYNDPTDISTEPLNIGDVRKSDLANEDKLKEIARIQNLTNWLRCFALWRYGYENAALDAVKFLLTFVNEAEVIRKWKGTQGVVIDLINGLLKQHPINDNEKYEEYRKLLDQLAPAIKAADYTPIGFSLPNEKYFKERKTFFDWDPQTNPERKKTWINETAEKLTDYILFLRGSKIIIETICKMLEISPAAYLTKADKWNQIFILAEKFVASIDMYVLAYKGKDKWANKILKQESPAVLPFEETRKFWDEITTPIFNAIQKEWSAKEIREMENAIKGSRFYWFYSPTDLDLVLKFCGTKVI